MSLKDKPLKKCHTDKRKMIDDLHKEKSRRMNSLAHFSSKNHPFNSVT